MATKQITQFIDDLDGEVLDSGTTVRFALDGRSYEIDLSPTNADSLRRALAPFIEVARSVDGGGRTAPRSRAGRGDLALVRDWARANGHEVGERGRVPAPVLQAFESAH